MLVSCHLKGCDHMVLLLSNISLEDFTKLSDKREYTINCKFFDLHTRQNKSNIYDLIYTRCHWYKYWSKNTLYVIVMTDKYWQSICGNLQNSYAFTNWTNIPKYIEDASDPQYTKVPTIEQIITDEDVAELLKNIKEHNFKENVFLQISFPNKKPSPT